MLGEREKEMLQLVADGLIYKEISRKMGCATGTTNNRMAEVLRKLGATTRAQAVTIGFRKGWLK